MAEIILPGTYIKVFDEALISAGAVSSGNIGIVGTASKGPKDKVVILGSFSEAKEIFGEADPWKDGKSNELTLMRALEQVYNNGGKTVYAVRVASPDAKCASEILKGSGNKDAVKLKAKNAGEWGNKISCEVVTEDESKKVIIKYLDFEESYIVKTSQELSDTINENSKIIKAELMASLNLYNAAESKFSDGNSGSNTSKNDYKNGLEELENEIVNIIVLAGQDTSYNSVLEAHLKVTSGIKRERIGLIGCASDDVADMASHSLANDRIILVGPGLVATEVNPETRKERKINLGSGYTAAAVAGLISSIAVQTSPTNKILTVEGLNVQLNSSKLEKLVQNRVLAIEKREGYRIVKGITTATNSAWHQITTRRIVDYAIYGVRSGCNPYIGKLNNERVRGALKATLDAFLTKMVQEEALIGYELDVTANRAQQIAGEVIVTMIIQPTFSIDFIKVSMYLG